MGRLSIQSVGRMDSINQRTLALKLGKVIGKNGRDLERGET